MAYKPLSNTPPDEEAPKKRGFPDSSIWLIEFDDGLGVLFAAVTERDVENRRIVLRKVAYVQIETTGWGVTALPELHVVHDDKGVFRVVEPKSGKVLASPSRIAYEMGFISKDIFDLTIGCIKDKSIEPIYELVVVTFGTRKGFAVENGGLTAPEDYANAHDLVDEENRFPHPPPVKV